MRFEEVYGRWTESRLTQGEAAELLGVGERQFRRQCRRYESDGAGRVGPAPGAWTPAPAADRSDEVLRLVNQYRDRYVGWSVKHFYSKYREQKGGRSYNFVRLTLQREGVVEKAKRRGAHRRKRERRPLPGMMLHQDGSRHEWLPGQQHDLIVTLDDATSAIYSAFLVDEEGTMSRFAGVAEVITQFGLFNSLYTDRGSHYWHTRKAGGKVDPAHLVNATAIKKYDGLKHSGDEADARYLAHLLRLGILPTGTILPPEQRAVRDLARKHMQLVCTAIK